MYIFFYFCNAERMLALGKLQSIMYCVYMFLSACLPRIKPGDGWIHGPDGNISFHAAEDSNAEQQYFAIRTTQKHQNERTNERTGWCGVNMMRVLANTLGFSA